MNESKPVQTGKTEMSCGFQEDIKAYLDNELSTVQRLRFQMHLARCGGCRQALVEMERLGSEMRKFGATDSALTPDMRARLVNGLSGVQPDVPSGAETDRPTPKPFWKQKPLLVFGGGGVTVAASIMVFMTLYRPIDQMEVAKTASVGVTMPAVANAPVAVAEMAPAAPPAPSAPPGVPEAVGLEVKSLPELKSYPIERKPEIARQLDQAARVDEAYRGHVDSFQDNDKFGITERQVHREASLGIAVTSVEQTDNQIVTLVESSGGYIASNNLNTDEGGYKYAELTIKVPVKEFDTILAQVSKYGDLRSKNLTGEDITEKVSDATSDEQVMVDEVEKLNAQLKTSGMTEKRTIQTEAQIRETKIELARVRARLGLLRKMSTLSTLTISLTEKAKKVAVAQPESGFMHDLHETNRAAMAAFQSAVRVPIVMIVWILAFSPIWVPLILLYRWAALKNRGR